jgi:prepilin-type N-terminal cleavage/methylation domain-containing protein
LKAIWFARLKTKKLRLMARFPDHGGVLVALRRLGRHEGGFTLVEMAIVLAIMGVLIAMLVPLLGNIAETNRNELTMTRLGDIDDALIVFLRQTGRLPCPAAPDGEPLGVERSGCSIAGSNDGIVPFRTLGLPQAGARDGYGDYFTYHVASDYAAASLPAGLNDEFGYCLVAPGVPNGTLMIEDLRGNPVTGQPIAYVVVSHGKNGRGRYGPPGTDRINTEAAGLLESENSDGDDRFVDSVPIAESAERGPYDDRLLWRTRDALADKAVEFGCAR